jgi:predicted peptidase
MGGFGTWEFALRYPQRFAAIVPVAGGYIYQSAALPPNLCDLKDLPVWVFHGGKDTNVAPEQGTSLVDALKACHGNVRLTFYPDANHADTAAKAYTTPELFQWLSDWPKETYQNEPER